MISKSILFYWSKGAATRRRILKVIHERNINNKPCFLNIISKKFNLTHVAVKKHVDLLVEDNYIRPINPLGKPIFLELTASGRKMLNELLR